MDKTEYTYQEVEKLLLSPETCNMVFEEESKYVHVAMTHTGSIRWAWGSGGYYRDIDCFNEKQKDFLLNAKFKHSLMGI